ncbi:MAG: preprotein translocase subunit YajC [Acidimicrobiales bacterium]
MSHLAAVLVATKTTTSAGSAAVSYIILLVLIAGVYFFFIRPRSMAARRQRETVLELGIGDEILTGAGIFGTVVQVDSDRITIETAPGTRLTVLRSTVARRITAVHDGSDGADHDEHAHGDGDHGTEHDS